MSRLKLQGVIPPYSATSPKSYPRRCGSTVPVLPASDSAGRVEYDRGRRILWVKCAPSIADVPLPQDGSGDDVLQLWRREMEGWIGISGVQIEGMPSPLHPIIFSDAHTPAGRRAMDALSFRNGFIAPAGQRTPYFESIDQQPSTYASE